MRRTVIFILLFVVLGGAAWWLTQNDEAVSVGTIDADRKFRVEKADLVYKIIIDDVHGNHTKLTRNGSKWLYNDEFPVRGNAIDNLMEAITKIEIQYKPPKNAVPTMMNSFKNEGINVKVFGAEGELLKAYIIGGATPEETGTFAMLDGADQPFVTEIPGWTGNLRFRYRLKGDDWRERIVFQDEVESIQKLSIAYPKQRNKSFVLERNNKNQFSVSPYYEAVPIVNKTVDQAKVEHYLAGYQKVPFRGFYNDDPARDSILQTIPFCDIVMVKSNGDEHKLRLYPMKSNFKDESKIFHYQGLWDKKDFIVIDWNQVDKLFWSYDSFFGVD